MESEIWYSPWRRTLKGGWACDLAPSRKERHRKGLTITVTPEESKDLDHQSLKELLRLRFAEGVKRLA